MSTLRSHSNSVGSYQHRKGPLPHAVIRGIEDPSLSPHEVQTMLLKLKSGNVMKNYSTKKKPESRTFFVSENYS